MKAYIELNSVYFISTNGITLTMENPRIEKTEETFEKLKDYIDKGYLHLVELNDDYLTDEIIDTGSVYIPEEAIESCEAPMVQRYEIYIEEQLKGMKKEELLKICEEFDIQAKSNLKNAELIKLILDFYKE